MSISFVYIAEKLCKSRVLLRYANPTALCEPYCAMRIGFVPSDAVIKETPLDLKGVSFMARGYEKDIFRGLLLGFELKRG